MAKPLTSWLVPSFPQHNLCPVVAGCCLHFSVRKLQDKFTSLRQVNSPNSWEKFQICCTDMYLIRFLPNFAVFCVFLWILRLCDHVKYQKPRLTMSCIIYKLATKNLHLATIFLQLVAKRRPEDFFNFAPWMLVNFSGVQLQRTVSKFRKRKRKSLSCVHVLNKKWN